MTSSPVLQNHYLRAALGSGAAYIGARLLTSRISKLASARIGLPAVSALTTGAVLLARRSPQPSHHEERPTTDGIRVVERDGVQVSGGCVEIGSAQAERLNEGWNDYERYRGWSGCKWFSSYFGTEMQKRIDHSPETVRDVICLQAGFQVSDALPKFPSIHQATALMQVAPSEAQDGILAGMNSELKRLQRLMNFANEIGANRAIIFIQERLMEIRPWDDEESVGDWLAYAETLDLPRIKRDCIDCLVENPEWEIPKLGSVTLPYFNPCDDIIYGKWAVTRLVEVAESIHLELDVLDFHRLEDSSTKFPALDSEWSSSGGILQTSQLEQLAPLAISHSHLLRGDWHNFDFCELIRRLCRDSTSDKRLCVVAADPWSAIEPVRSATILPGQRRKAEALLARRPDFKLRAPDLKEFTRDGNIPRD